MKNDCGNMANWKKVACNLEKKSVGKILYTHRENRKSIVWTREMERSLFEETSFNTAKLREMNVESSFCKQKKLKEHCLKKLLFTNKRETRLFQQKKLKKECLQKILWKKENERRLFQQRESKQRKSKEDCFKKILSTKENETRLIQQRELNERKSKKRLFNQWKFKEGCLHNGNGKKDFLSSFFEQRKQEGGCLNKICELSFCGTKETEKEIV